MSGSKRPLLAARTLSGEALNDGSDGAYVPPSKQPSGRPKRTLIESACSACRKRKSRCDGARPICARCQNLRTECHYEAEEGESRWSALRRRNQVLETERDQVRELLDSIQRRPELEALEIFQRLRVISYEEIPTLLRQIKEGSHMIPSKIGPLQLAIGATNQQQRLPPIQTILDGPDPTVRTAPALHPTSSQQSISLSSEESRSSSSNPEFVQMPVLQHVRTLPNTLGARPRHPQLRGPAISLSSEESTDSIQQSPS